jgi:hypothetical protein
LYVMQTKDRLCQTKSKLISLATCGPRKPTCLSNFCHYCYTTLVFLALLIFITENHFVLS